MSRSGKKPKLKKVAYEFITPYGDDGLAMYSLLRELIRDHDHRHLANARIALAWHVSWQPNVDGQIKNGIVRRASDLDREIGGTEAFDFVIVLRKDFWKEPNVTERRRRALLDEMLCFCAVRLDGNGEPVVDERGRTVYRLRDYDLKGFTSNIEKHGIWARNQEEFYRAIQRSRNRNKGRFLAFTTLYENLLRVGITVPIEAIAMWTDVERREAMVWIDLKRDGLVESLPTFIQRHQQPIQDTLPPMPPQGFPEPSEASR